MISNFKCYHNFFVNLHEKSLHKYPNVLIIYLQLCSLWRSCEREQPPRSREFTEGTKHFHKCKWSHLDFLGTAHLEPGLRPARQQGAIHAIAASLS